MNQLISYVSSYSEGRHHLASVLDPSLGSSLQQLPATASSQFYGALMQDLTRFGEMIGNPRLSVQQLQLAAAPMACVADSAAPMLQLLDHPADQAKRQQAQSELPLLSA
jgi:hypothetical protein